MWYEYDQNNSGGFFDIDDAKGIGPRVWIEAENAADADAKAMRLGIYFDGVADGMDCSCCGDRWYSANMWYKENSGKEELDINAQYDFNWHDTVYAHHVDGSLTRITKEMLSA